MVDADLDRRLAEAAADVESLRQESRKLDLELEERLQGSWPNEFFAEGSVSAASAVANEALAALEERLRHATVRDVPTVEANVGDQHANVGDQQAKAEPTATGAEESTVPLVDQYSLPPQKDAVEDDLVASSKIEDVSQVEKEQEDEDNNAELDALWNEYLPGLDQKILPPSALPEAPPEAPPEEPVPPPQIVPTTIQGNGSPKAWEARQAATLLSDKDVAGMTRRQRIALLEHEEGNGYGHEQLGTGLRHADPEDLESGYKQDKASPAAHAALDVAERLRLAREGAPPAQHEPRTLSDEEFAKLSRRERIALLEEGNESKVQERKVPGRRPEEPWAVRTPAPTYAPPVPAQAEDQLDDEDWLELRRQNRKMRLQQHSTTRPPVRATDAATSADAEFAYADVERLHAEQTSLSPQHAVEELARLKGSDPRFVSTCNAITSGAHKLTSGGLVRAMEVFTAGEASQDEKSAAAFRLAAEALLGCLTPQLQSLGTSAVVDSLKAMSAAKVQEQTYLDMLLAQLLVLLRRERISFSAPVLSSIAGTLGKLQEAGMSAKRAASGASSTANRRCVESLSEIIVGEIAEFREEDVALIGGSYMVNFMDDVQRRTVLRTAAQLQAGLTSQGSAAWVTAAMVRVERAVRGHSFAFIASLPDDIKDYLMKLKASA
mmetsp:Transcript_18186/g.31933  ORF Transcript_18186/g.31933 Transcript_18186/m.31933 type:complete len:665 (-) Transcript_18186:84-2078(-)